MIFKLTKKLFYMFKCCLSEIESFNKCVWFFIITKLKPNRYVVIQAWVKTKGNKIVPNNWGDDINVYFFQEIINKKILILPPTKIAFKFPLKTYVMIGSCIEYANKKNSIVYGSGLMNDKVNYAKPNISSQILAVRGELTYKWLISNGISCPKILGDPALLLPLYYKPKITQKKYKISYIPHHSEYKENMSLIKYLENMGIHIINMTDYYDWKSIPNQICESDLVLSSSLHGIIVSETYGVPNIWTIAMKQIEGFEFKFYDFYSSIKKYDIKPYYLTQESSYAELEVLRERWEKVDINYHDLLLAMPFESTIKEINK